MASAEPAEDSDRLQELDVEKLHSLPSEQQDLYLLTFTSDLTRHVAALDGPGATAQQQSVQKELFKIINLSSPAPTRVIRNNLANAISGVLGKGDRKILFETVNKLLALVNNGKFEKLANNKHAAVTCLGAIFEAAGQSAISLSSMFCYCILRLLKSAGNYAGFRSSVFKSLGRIALGVGKSMDEATAREMWKQARTYAANDKAFVVQANACWCLQQLLQHTSFFDGQSDFERLQSILWKVMDSPSSMVRRAAASCQAEVLVKSYSGVASPAPTKKARKVKPKPGEQDGIDESTERSSSPAPPKTSAVVSFTLVEILRRLSNQYCLVTTTNRVRSAIAYCYMKLFKSFDEHTVQNEYFIIARHFFEDVLGSANIIHQRYRLLITRKFIRILLHSVIGRQILGEAAQIKAIRVLVNSVIKDYPQSELKERPEPSKEALVAAMDAVSSLVQGLGVAASACADLCRDALLQVLQHPSHTVQTHASKCLQALARSCPHQLLPTASICLNNIQREVGQLTGPRRYPRRCIGYAFGLAAIVSTASAHPLYGSVDLYSRILSQATSILKSSSGSDIRISSTQIQVAWIMIGSLMSLGPSFVKIHLSQLLLMWKNALPKPLTKENIGEIGSLELCFLAHVRECALGSIKAFLEFNGRLLTLDVTRRLAAMLQNTTDFVQSLPEKKTTDEAEKMLSHSLQLRDYDLMLRRRVFDCTMRLFSLAPESSYESMLQTSILSIAISSFAEPSSLAPSSFTSMIAASSANIEDVWEVGDNFGFGLTGLAGREEIKSLFIDEEGRSLQALSSQSVEANFDQIIRTPTSGDVEHDSVQLYAPNTVDTPDPLEAAVINSAVRLFARTVALQPSRVQQGALEQISTLLAPTSQQQTAAKSFAATVNVATALLLALHTATQAVVSPGSRAFWEVENAVKELLHVFIVHADRTVRSLAAESIGRLCKIMGSEFSSREVNHLIETIVSNREPHARAGCAMALGCIHTQLGGMAAGLHLKNIVSVLTSLANDPQPTVHFWALDALSRVADSAGLAFSSHVSSTLGLIAQLYVLDSHNEEISAAPSSNLEVEHPTRVAIARCVDSLINVLGPDLQDMAKTRNMILTLTYQFQLEGDPLVASESLRCLEHLSMYAPGHISFAPYIRQLQTQIADEDPDVRDTALKGLYNAMRRGAEEVLHTADESLQSQLWLTLHHSYGTGTIKNIISDWVEQSGLIHIDAWIQRIQKVLTTIKTLEDEPGKVESTKSRGAEEPDLQDEEIAGFNAASKTEKEDSSQAHESNQELLRWQVRAVAMDCLNHVLSAVLKEAEDQDETPLLDTLQPRIADIIRIAFSSSTASVVDIRIRGVQVIERILEIFGNIPDPDFPEVNVLEQYQAQISSALTPAFAADSSPLLAAEAIGVCASFISTGIVRDKERMGRILKLLVSALEDFSVDAETLSIGDLKDLSSGSQIMVQLAVFEAWAKLQVASREHKYLHDIVKPHLVKLTPLWLSSLREYARLKFEPDISNMGALSNGLDSIYAALNRESLLKFYQSCWLEFVHAIASLIEEDSEFVFNALDDKDQNADVNGDTIKRNEISYRDEPVAFFFVLFGISYEALISSSTNQSQVTQQSMLEILRAMKKILLPSVAGLAIYQVEIFSETMDLLDRLALTEGYEVQTAIIEIAQSLCLEHPSARKEHKKTESEEDLSDDIEQLFELTRIIVLVISNHVPNLSSDSNARPQLSDSAVSLVVLALSALVEAAEVFPVVIKSDLQACIFHVFATVLSTGACQHSLVPQALPIFRRFLQSLANSPQHDTPSQLRSAMSRFLAILKHAQRRESEASLPCEKNTLLAGTILLTTSARIFDPSDPLLKRFTDELCDCLDNRMTTQVAAGLSRSLLLLSLTTKSQTGQITNATEQSIAASIFPRLIDFCANLSEIEGTKETRPIVAQALTSFAAAQPKNRRSVAYCVVVPTLLKRAKGDGDQSWAETSRLLMEILSKDPAAFREIVGRLSGESRTFLEEVIKSGNLNSERAARDDENAGSKEPSIALKFDF